METSPKVLLHMCISLLDEACETDEGWPLSLPALFNKWGGGGSWREDWVFEGTQRKMTELGFEPRLRAWLSMLVDSAALRARPTTSTGECCALVRWPLRVKNKLTLSSALPSAAPTLQQEYWLAAERVRSHGMVRTEQ